MQAPAFADLAEWPDERLLPPLDRADADESRLSEIQSAWRRDGVVILPNFLPSDLIDRYSRRRQRLNDPAGWRDLQPYLDVPELREIGLYPPLMRVMQEIIGEPMMLHLCLTGWVTTERDWHQDDYLNPPFVRCWYGAVWMALDDIRADSGPFEYVAG